MKKKLCRKHLLRLMDGILQQSFRVQNSGGPRSGHQRLISSEPTMADPVDAVPSPLDDEYEQDASSWPTRHLLADTWEENHQIRKNLRLTGKMMVWPKVDLTGVATLQSLSANGLCVGDALCVWATHCPDHAKPPPVEWLKDEASVHKQFFGLLGNQGSIEHALGKTSCDVI